MELLRVGWWWWGFLVWKVVEGLLRWVETAEHCQVEGH